MDPLQVLHARVAAVEQPIAIQVDRILDPVGLSGVTVGLVVSRPVTAPAPGARLDQRRAQPGASPRHCPPDARAHGVNIITVDTFTWHAVACRPRRY